MDKRIEKQLKKVSIIYNQPLTQIQGINYVNNSFVMGGKYFKENGLLLSKIYAPDAVFDCTTHEHLDLIGSNVGQASYQRQRKLRGFLRELLSSEHLLGACIKMYFNHTLNAKKAIKRLARENDDSDYLIFQDMSSARQYYKRFGRKDGVKSLLILHCSNHPLEQTEPTFPGYYKHEWLKKRSYRQCDEVMKLVDRVVYLSEHAVNASTLPAEKKNYIFNGVEDISYVPTKIDNTVTRMVSVGSVSVRKGQLQLVKAMAELPVEIRKKVHLTIVGGGNEYEECQQLINTKSVEEIVTMTGPRNDVVDILKEQDVFLLPSQLEGMPMSIIEAMRQGLYIMATDTGGISEMIGEGYGELVTRDPKELAASITHVVKENLVNEENKQKSRARFEKDFTLRKMIDRYSETLLSL